MYKFNSKTLTTINLQIKYSTVVYMLDAAYKECSQYIIYLHTFYFQISPGYVVR